MHQPKIETSLRIVGLQPIEFHGPEVLQKKNEDLHIQQSIDFTSMIGKDSLFLPILHSQYLTIFIYHATDWDNYLSVLAYVARHDPTMRPSWGADSFEGQHAQQAWTRTNGGWINNLG